MTSSRVDVRSPRPFTLIDHDAAHLNHMTVANNGAHPLTRPFQDLVTKQTTCIRALIVAFLTLRQLSSKELNTFDAVRA